MIKKLLLILPLFFLFYFTITLAADKHYIRGKVIDESGERLSGVTVRVKEQKSIGTSTDDKGEFSILLPENGKHLLFTYIGMNDNTVAVSSKTSYITVQMEIQSTETEQVVITGYAQTTTKKMTGSVGIIDGKKLANQPQPNIDALLQGQIAGVSVSATSGQPGKEQKIRIRGTNTLTGDADPLWVIDGVPMQNSVPEISSSEIKTGNFDNMFITGIAGINPNDIENITVLKDAAAAAIYGSRAAGGVIIVTTKKGQAGKMKINYSANLSVVMPPQKDNNLMNSKEKLTYEQTLWDEFSATDFAAGKTNYPVIGIVGIIRSGKGKFQGWTEQEQNSYIDQLGNIETDWYDELFRNAISTNHHLSLSGGTEKVTYYTSLGYTHDAGLVKKNDYDRYNFTTNLNITPSQKIKINFGIDVSYLNSKAPALESVDPFKYAYFANPYESPYNADGSYRADETYYSLGEYNNLTGSYKAPYIPACGFNIMREMNETESNTSNTNTSLRGGLEWKIIPELKFEGLASYSFSNNNSESIYGAETKAAFDNRLSVDSQSRREYASIAQNKASMNSYMVRGHFAYSDNFGKNHALSILAGAELRGSTSHTLYSKRYGYDPITENNTTPLPDPNGVGYEKLKEYLAALDLSSGQLEDEQRFASFYASADYYLMNKYIFNVSFRTDGSSNFGSKEQFNPTWALGAAWHLGEESFMKFLKPAVNRMTLRIASGFTGNISRAASPQLIIAYYDNYRNLNNNIYHIGKVVGAPNPKLRWEKTQDVKASLDFGLFNDRLSGIVEAYYRKSSDVVTSERVLSTTGYPTQKYNTAEIKNRGIEVTLNSGPVKTKDFSLNLSVNMALNRNIVSKYNPPYRNSSTSYNAEMLEGFPTDGIFSGRCTGIDPETGLYNFELRPDAVIRTKDDLHLPDNYLFYLGTPTSPLTGGFSLSADYKEFRLSVNGVYSVGAKQFEYIRPPVSYSSTEYGQEITVNEMVQTFQNDLFTQYLNVNRDMFNRWTPENKTDVSAPRLWNPYTADYGFSRQYPTETAITQGAFLTKLSYLRIKNIILGYKLPKKYIQRSKISNLDFSLSLNNFLTITQYKGMDPETPGATYPISRSVTFSVNIGF